MALPIVFACVRCSATARAATEAEVLALAAAGWDARPTTCPPCTPMVKRGRSDAAYKLGAAFAAKKGEP